MPIPQPLISPRIASLKRAVEAGDIAALDKFWNEVEKTGTPLIEPIDNDNQYAFVTFLWRTDEEIEHVIVTNALENWWAWNQCADSKLVRLSPTNLYFRTYRVRTDMRFVYRLAPNQPIIYPDYIDDWDAYMANCRPDPPNPNQFVEDVTFSVVEMPTAPHQHWIIPQANAPAGQLNLHLHASDLLEGERRLWVYTPPGYRADREPYHLLVLFDAAYTRWIPVPTILDNMLDAGLIPPLVVVILENTDRWRDLGFYQPYVEYLAHEMMPWVRQNHHVTTNPAQTVIGGFSRGGVMAAYVSLCHPELFGNVLSQSGSFQNASEHDPHDHDEEWLTRQFVARDKLPVRFYLEAGLLENETDQPSLYCAPIGTCAMSC